MPFPFGDEWPSQQDVCNPSSVLGLSDPLDQPSRFRLPLEFVLSFCCLLTCVALSLLSNLYTKGIIGESSSKPPHFTATSLDVPKSPFYALLSLLTSMVSASLRKPTPDFITDITTISVPERPPTFGVLPTELWHAVFREVVGGPGAEKPQKVARIASVCKLWRNIAVGSSELWDTVVVYVDRPSDLKYPSFSFWRSSRRPLHIYIRRMGGYPETLLPGGEKEESAHLVKFLRLLRPYYDRVKTLHVEVCGSLAIANVFGFQYSGVATQLEDLSLIAHQPSRIWIQGEGDQRRRVIFSTPWERFQATVPHLERLTLTASVSLRPQVFANFKTVRSVTLVFPLGESIYEPSTLLHTLSSLEYLKYLKLDGSASPISDTVLSINQYHFMKFTLPALQDLVIDTMPREFVGYFLSYMEAPVLSSMELTGLRNCITVTQAFTQMHLSKSSPLLNTFSLRSFGPMVFHTILPYLGTCKHLKLLDAAALDDYDMARLSLEQHMPQLVSLELGGAHLMSVDAIRRVVMFRKPWGALEDLRVYHPRARLSAIDRTWFRENVPTFYWGSPPHQ